MSDTSPPPPRAAVFFDFDGTLVDSTIAHYYGYFMKRRLPPVLRDLWHGWFLLKCISYLIVDKIDRSKLNIFFYRNYRGLPAGEIKAMAADCYRDAITPRCFDQITECIAEHKEANRKVVLVTGSIDFIVAPFVKEYGVDAVLAPALLESNGVFTGELDGPPIGGEEKPKRMRKFAEEMNIDLALSHGYGDSIADLPMLEAVGHPHAVNPDKALEKIAISRGWPIHQWTRDKTRQSETR
jgi:alcohol-forming fatty acyl-CoA reductase